MTQSSGNLDGGRTQEEIKAVAEKRRWFEGVRRTLLAGLTALLAVCLIFSWRTRDAMEHLPFLRGRSAAEVNGQTTRSLVDLHTWQTAQALAPLAVSAEEVELAREAERLADHETDQAFAAALRLAVPQHRVLSARAQMLMKQIADLRSAAAEDQRQVKAATAARENAGGMKLGKGAPLPAGGDDLAIATAQLGLDMDELKDAQADLARELGDDRTRIQQELAAHEAAMQKYDAQANDPGQVAVLSSQQFSTLAARIAAWQSQRSRRRLLEQAVGDTRRSVVSLTTQHDAIEGQANNSAGAQSGNEGEPGSEGDARLDEIRRRSSQRQLLSIFDDRIATVQQLALIYAKWTDQVMVQHRIVGHLLLQSVAQVVLILMAMLMGGALVRRWMGRPTMDRGRMRTLHTVLSLGVQVVGIVAILLVIFGAPKQTPTILGLATAGLTVVLQDFILAFFGWFVLMGRNGISVGDAVEIDGITGNVVDIGLFRTTMLETGNWTAQGHPTGRRVAIINKFAINGKYFNFSTAGQWLWDEITIGVGAMDDPYGRAKAIQTAVVEETREGSQLADQEWQRSDRLHGSGQFRSEPEVNLRPGAGGMEIVLRYVTRASERVGTRNRLYQRVLSILRGPEQEMGARAGEAVPGAVPSNPPSA
ncbi:MAG: hypothetical protein NVSMB3_08430 [Acidobacteriaceae bacterium]